jgi:hypothetical protein
MPARYETEQEVIAASDVDTEVFLALALTLPVCDAGNFLMGRSHAWYAIAQTQYAAIEFALRQGPAKQRRIAANALAMAGYSLDDIQEAMP